jgi:hypothetical protein
MNVAGDVDDVKLAIAARFAFVQDPFATLPIRSRHYMTPQ